MPESTSEIVKCTSERPSIGMSDTNNIMILTTEGFGTRIFLKYVKIQKPWRGGPPSVRSSGSTPAYLLTALAEFAEIERDLDVACRSPIDQVAHRQRLVQMCDGAAHLARLER